MALASLGQFTQTRDRLNRRDSWCSWGHPEAILYSG